MSITPTHGSAGAPDERTFHRIRVVHETLRDGWFVVAATLAGGIAGLLIQWWLNPSPRGSTNRQIVTAFTLSDSRAIRVIIIVACALIVGGAARMREQRRPVELLEATEPDGRGGAV